MRIAGVPGVHGTLSAQGRTPAARYAMLHRDSGRWGVQLLAVEDDPGHAVEAVERARGFGDRADALRDGRPDA